MATHLVRVVHALPSRRVEELEQLDRRDTLSASSPLWLLLLAASHRSKVRGIFARAGAEDLVAVVVVPGTFLGIAQRLVRLLDPCKASRGALDIVRALVWVPNESCAAVSARRTDSCSGKERTLLAKTAPKQSVRSGQLS